jgi:hypothetical protein
MALDDLMRRTLSEIDTEPAPASSSSVPRIWSGQTAGRDAAQEGTGRRAEVTDQYYKLAAESSRSHGVSAATMYSTFRMASVR